MDTKNKNGRPSNKDIAYIKLHLDDDPVEVARAISKNVAVIKKWMTKFKNDKIKPENQFDIEKAAYDIKKRPFWSDIERQFSSDECKLFIYHWSRIIEQFRDDVLPTEELQIIDLVKLEMLLSRNLTKTNKTLQNLIEIELLLEQEKSKDSADQDINTIRDLHQQIGITRQCEMESGKEWRDLLGKKKIAIDAIKGSREQRVERLENSKLTVIGWMKQLISDKELRTKLGAEMEKMRLATYKEKLRLSEYHKYEDGEIDQPFLTPETFQLVKTIVDEMETNTADGIQKV